MRHIFMDNYQLCNEISDRVVHHLVHSVATQGRHVQCLKFLLTIVKGDGKYVKKCQDKVMTEVRRFQRPHDGARKRTASDFDDVFFCVTLSDPAARPAGERRRGRVGVLQRPLLLLQAGGDDGL